MPKSKYYYPLVDAKTSELFIVNGKAIIWDNATDPKCFTMVGYAYVKIPASALNKFIKQYIPDKK